MNEQETPVYSLLSPRLAKRHAKYVHISKPSGVSIMLGRTTAQGTYCKLCALKKNRTNGRLS